MNRILKLLRELLPGGAKTTLTAPQAKVLIATARPRDVAGQTQRQIVVALIDEPAADQDVVPVVSVYPADIRSRYSFCTMEPTMTQ